MHLLSELRRRISAALAGIADPTPELLDMVRPSQDPKFGDYQANCAMPLGKTLGQPPRKIAEQIVANLRIDDLCQTPEIAGPGFINLKLKNDVLAKHTSEAARDERLGVPLTATPRTYVVDYSGPNVAKPMHVGHIRSTVIGDALARILRFEGHRVVGDNHVGDWGTQFGMILYGYKNFVDAAALQAKPVDELARLYKLVRQLVDYHAAIAELPKQRAQLDARTAELTRMEAEKLADPKEAKKYDKAIRQKRESLAEAKDELAGLEKKVAKVEADTTLKKLAAEHPEIGAAVLRETAKLHEGDAENKRLWEQFLPACRAEIDRIYERLNIKFDTQLGESFFHDRLGPVVKELLDKKIATESNGATVVFLDGFDNPMLVRKQDGAFLYATTDLATIQYRLEQYKPDAILYVVDHRQSLHFEQLFAAARKLWGIESVELQHIKFGTVLGKDGKPYKTREGTAEGLDSLLDEAINRSEKLVTELDTAKETPQFTPAERQHIGQVVGLSAVKYADLCQNRESDYEFDFDKMCATKGNTAAYMQYAYARTRGIFEKAGGREKIDKAAALQLNSPKERALAVACLRFAEALDGIIADYRPHLLTAYLFELSNLFNSFYEDCPVVGAPTTEAFQTRLTLCYLTERIIARGLDLLGIETVERM
jgi:arginyl-tRNA synthetase